MSEQLQMVWPVARLGETLTWELPQGYLLRNFSDGDEQAYLDIMHLAGFESWNEDSMKAVLDNAVPKGIIFIEHEATSRIVATAMGWLSPSELFPDSDEMGWVGADPDHSGKGLGVIVTAAATRAVLEAGGKGIYLRTDDWRLPAIKSYLRVGYESI